MARHKDHTHTTVHHHEDGSHTMDRHHKDGSVHSSAHHDLDGVHDALQDHLGEPNEGEGNDEKNEPLAPPVVPGMMQGK